MSLFQDTTLLPSTLQHGNSLKGLKVASNGQSSCRQLCSKGSIASLVSAARNPVAAIGDVLEGLRDGLTKEERAERQRLENKKQVLYIRLRDVSVELSIRKSLYYCLKLIDLLYSPQLTKNGKLRPKRSMTSRATMPGNRSSIHRTTMLLS